MARVKLHNWSGHGNLGDDEMDRILRFYLGKEHEIVEGNEWDWKVVGGGTLIAPASEFLHGLSENPRRTILFSIGVAPSWAGHEADYIRQCKRIYTRDYYSSRQLQKFEIPTVQSVDMWFAHKPRLWIPRTGKVMANVVLAPEAPNPEANFHADRLLKELKNVDYFAMSSVEDMTSMPSAKLYKAGKDLINDLSEAHTVYATRLHAHVAAWIAGVRDIRSINYDPKIKYFKERVSSDEPMRLHEIALSHLQELNNLCHEM